MDINNILLISNIIKSNIIDYPRLVSYSKDNFINHFQTLMYYDLVDNAEEPEQVSRAEIEIKNVAINIFSQLNN